MKKTTEETYQMLIFGDPTNLQSSHRLPALHHYHLPC